MMIQLGGKPIKPEQNKQGNPWTQSVLVEVRGDWKFFGETFGFPKHNTKKGCCWLCECTPAQVRAVKNILLDLLAYSAWA